MTNERKKLCTAVFINFLVGIMVGIILFYGQSNSGWDVQLDEYTYVTTVEIADFFRVSWLDMMWIFSAFIIHNILPLVYIYPIVVIRGCCHSFCAMYLFQFVGVKEGVASVISQCFSILPILMYMCIRFVEKRRRKNLSMGESLSLSRAETLSVFMVSLFAGALETLFFRLLCLCLF